MRRQVTVRGDGIELRGWVEDPEPDGEPPPLLSEAQAADLLGVSRTWLFNQRKAGRVSFVRLGGKNIRYRRSQLDAMLDGMTEPAT